MATSRTGADPFAESSVRGFVRVWFRRFVPPHLSINGALLLGCQVWISCILLLNTQAVRVPYEQRSPFQKWLVIGVLILCPAALLASYGIWKNRWWAYFLELAVLGIIVVAGLSLPDSPPDSRSLDAVISSWGSWGAGFVTVMNILQVIGSVLLMVSGAHWLVSRGLAAYRTGRGD